MWVRLLTSFSSLRVWWGTLSIPCWCFYFQQSDNLVACLWVVTWHAKLLETSIRTNHGSRRRTIPIMLVLNLNNCLTVQIRNRITQRTHGDDVTPSSASHLYSFPGHKGWDGSRAFPLSHIIARWYSSPIRWGGYVGESRHEGWGMGVPLTQQTVFSTLEGFPSATNTELRKNTRISHFS